MKTYMKYKVLSLVLAAALAVSTLTLPAAASTRRAHYNDVSGHWAETAIERWSDYKIVQGVGGSFKPNEGMTRAQLATVLTNLLGLTEKAPNHYSDLKGSEWHADALLKATAAGIMEGNGSKIFPNNIVTREEAAVMLGRALAIAPDSQADLSQFTDAHLAAGWASGYLSAMVKAGILNGVGGSALSPNTAMTRASAMTVLDRAIAAYIPEDSAAVTLNQDRDGLVLVAAENVILSGMTNNDILIAPAAGRSRTAFQNAIVSGAITLRSSGAALLALSSDLNVIVLDSPESSLSLEANSSAAKVETTVQAAGSAITVNGSSLAMTVESRAEDVTISGTGHVSKVNISGNNTSVDTAGTTVTAAPGVTGTTVDGAGLSGGSSVSTPSPSQYTVYFDSNGGSSVPSVTVPAGGTVSRPVPPTREGYVFQSWQLGGGAYDFSLPVTRSMTLTARWLSLADTAAIIDGVGYATLPDAVEAARENDVIQLVNNAELGAQLTLDKPLTLDGNGKTIAVVHKNLTNGEGAGILITADNVALKDLTVYGPNATPDAWDNGQYGVKVYDSQNVTLTNLTVTNANAGILINSAQVAMSGSIDVSNNEFGGIEVSKSSLLPQPSALDISNAELIHNKESLSNPALWVDGVSDGNTIAGLDRLHAIADSPVKTHYYLTNPLLLAMTDAICYPYEDYQYTGTFDVKVQDLTVTVAGEYQGPSQLPDAMNDMARFLGGLYRHDNGKTVKEIVYQGETYRWANTPANLGSNWVKDVNLAPDSGNTLVSDIVSAYQQDGNSPISMTLNGPGGIAAVTLNFAVQFSA